MSREKTTETVDEVEELLRAAADETLLQLSIDAHTVRGSSAQFIAPDLDRRFQALKSQPKSSTIPNKHRKMPAPAASSASDDVKFPKNVGEGDDDDLFARFAALKSSLPSHSSSAGSISNPGRDEPENGKDGDVDDEVQKLINWAIDAARLDPSPPSDTDCDNDDDLDDSSDEDEDDNGGTKTKEKRK